MFEEFENIPAGKCRVADAIDCVFSFKGKQYHGGMAYKGSATTGYCEADQTFVIFKKHDMLVDIVENVSHISDSKTMRNLFIIAERNAKVFVCK